jgi:hypothetical protein
MVSGCEPAGKGTINVIGLVGKPSGFAMAGEARPNAHATAARRLVAP